MGKLRFWRWGLLYLSEYLATGRRDYAEEMVFWADTLDSLPHDYVQPMHRGDVLGALSEVYRRFGVTGREVKVVEVGSGPRSRLTQGYDEGLFDLTAVDPLADRYKKRFNGRDFLLKGRGEDVADLLPPAYFHLGYASNSVDHSEHPERQTPLLRERI